MEEFRIDKWLWCVRLFKTRSLAAEACNAGKVKRNGETVKASRKAVPGDEYTISFNPLLRTIGILSIPKSRLPARLVPEYMEDRTPPEEIERAAMISRKPAIRRDPGSGRPTKKERRQIDKIIM